MKNLSIIYTLVFFIAITLNINAQTPVFRVFNKKTQIAFNSSTYRGEYLTFGKSTGTTNNGNWSIEYFNGGLNFWKPWPTSNSGNYKLFIADWGAVGINCTPNVFNSSSPIEDKLYVNGRTVSRGHLTWSDQRTKCQINNLPSALNKILNLRTVSFYDRANITIGNYNSETYQNEDSSKNFEPMGAEFCDTLKHFGLIAQEVKEILPSIVSETKSGVLAINYIEIVPLLIKSTQEQQKIIDSQTFKIEQLKQEVQNLTGKTVYTDVDKTKLFQNNPNPFRGTTTFTYYIDEATNVSSAVIEIRNIMGILQNSITLGDKSGLGKIEFNAENLPEGYYVYSLKVNGNLKDSKMLLIGD
jgi:hypothetical protein